MSRPRHAGLYQPPLVPRTAALAAISDFLSGDGRFLLVVGSMGSGKSTLISQLGRSLAEAGQTQPDQARWVYAGHFCHAERAVTISVTAVLDSWCAQLNDQLDGYAEELARSRHTQYTGAGFGPGAVGIKVHIDRFDPTREHPADAFVRLIAIPLARLAERAHLPPVLLAVDGVDEAWDANGRNDIFELLAGLTGPDLPPALRFLASSRPYRDLREAFQQAEWLDLDTISAQDVARYVTLRLAQDPALATRSRTPREERRFATMLADHVQRNFLFASKLLDDLGTSQRPLSEATLRALPRALADYYRTRLWRILGRQQTQSNVLGLLAVARAPLRADEMANLLGTEQHHVRTALTGLLPMLRTDLSLGATVRHYQLVDRSLAEFLLDPDEDQPALPTAAELHWLVAEPSCRAWANRWEHCDEPYVLQHVVAHLTYTSRMTSSGGRSSGMQRKARAEHLLREIVLDPGFVHARAATAGVDALHRDLTYALAALPEDATDVRALARGVVRQAHHLRDWDAARHPVLLRQQLQHEAVGTETPVLADRFANALGRSGLPHLALRWAGTPVSSWLTHTLPGQRGRITAVATFPDGTRAVTASQDGTARIWNLQTGALVHVLSRHEGGVTAVVVAPDGATVVTTSDDHTACVWDADSGESLRVLTGHQDTVTAAAISTDGCVITSSWDRTVRVWHSPREQVLHGHQGRVNAVRLVPGERRVVTAGGDGTVRVWDLDTARCAHTLTGHRQNVTTVDVVACGRMAVSRSADGIALLWDLVEGRLVRPLHEAQLDEKSAVTAVACAANHILTASRDGMVRLWNLDSGRPVQRRKLDAWAGGIVASADGSQALLTSWDGVRWWDLTGGADATLDRHAVTAVTITADGQRAITASDDGAARVWELHGDTRAGGNAHRGKITALAGTRRRLVTASDDHTARVWDPETGECLHTLAVHRDWVTGVAVTRDSNTAVTGSWDGTVAIWDAASGALRHTLHGHGEPVTSVAVTRDGSLAVTTSLDRTARVWEVATARLLRTLDGHRDWVTAVVVLDADRVITGSDDGTARVWQVHTGDNVICAGHFDRITGLAVTPDGTRVLTASRDGTARVWNPSNGHAVHTFAGHQGPVTGLAMDPTGTWAVTLSDDGTACWWSLRTGERAATLEGHGKPTVAVTVTADGDHVVAACDTRLLRVWSRRQGPDPTCTAPGLEPVTCLIAHPRYPDQFVVGTADGSVFCYSIRGGFSSGRVG